MQVVDANGNVFGGGIEITGSDGKPKGGGSGAQGPTGPQGIQGITGIQGLVGIQGFTGSQGTTGTGTQGATGSIGPQGTSGSNGSQGIQGVTGTGTQGIQGITGTGSQGTTGIQGSTGSQGVQGLNGSFAAQGVQGTQGIAGGGGGGGLAGVNNMLGNFQGTGSAFGITGAINASGNSTYSSTANRLDVYPFISNKTLPNSSLSINVSTLGAGVLSRLVIYADTSGFPSTKLYESTDIDCSTTGIKTIVAGFTFTAGTTYWLGFYTNGVTVVTAIPTASLIPIFTAFATGSPSTAWSRISTTLGAAPDPFQYNTYRNNPMPSIWIKPA